MGMRFSGLSRQRTIVFAPFLIVLGMIFGYCVLSGGGESEPEVQRRSTGSLPVEVEAYLRRLYTDGSRLSEAVADDRITPEGADRKFRRSIKYPIGYGASFHPPGHGCKCRGKPRLAYRITHPGLLTGWRVESWATCWPIYKVTIRSPKCADTPFVMNSAGEIRQLGKIVLEVNISALIGE